jgi:hypothetical protein
MRIKSMAAMASKKSSGINKRLKENNLKKSGNSATGLNSESERRGIQTVGNPNRERKAEHQSAATTIGENLRRHNGVLITIWI